MEKHKKISEIIVLLHSHSQRFFANVSLKVSNINNRSCDVRACRDTFVFYATDEEVSVGNKKILIIPDHVDVMNVARGLKLHDLILSFHLLSRTNISSKTFFRS